MSHCLSGIFTLSPYFSASHMLMPPSAPQPPGCNQQQKDNRTDDTQRPMRYFRHTTDTRRNVDLKEIVDPVGQPAQHQ
jgi:hypothetical protein